MRELIVDNFAADYIYTHGHDGRRFPKTAQVDKVGNSVPRHLASALVRANCPELIEQERAI